MTQLQHFGAFLGDEGLTDDGLGKLTYALSGLHYTEFNLV